MGVADVNRRADREHEHLKHDGAACPAVDRMPVAIDPAHAILGELGMESIGQGVDRRAAWRVNAERRERLERAGVKRAIGRDERDPHSAGGETAQSRCRLESTDAGSADDHSHPRSGRQLSASGRGAINSEQLAP